MQVHFIKTFKLQFLAAAQLADNTTSVKSFEKKDTTSSTQHYSLKSMSASHKKGSLLPAYSSDNVKSAFPPHATPMMFKPAQGIKMSLKGERKTRAASHLECLTILLD